MVSAFLVRARLSANSNAPLACTAPATGKKMLAAELAFTPSAKPPPMAAALGFKSRSIFASRPAGASVLNAISSLPGTGANGRATFGAAGKAGNGSEDQPTPGSVLGN